MDRDDCCGGGCHDGESYACDSTDLAVEIKPEKKHHRCLKEGGCDGEPVELQCIHSDAVFAAVALLIIASSIFGIGVGITIFSIATSAALGIILLGLGVMLIGGVGSVVFWTTLSDGIKVYKKIMKED